MKTRTWAKMCLKLQRMVTKESDKLSLVFLSLGLCEHCKQSRLTAGYVDGICKLQFESSPHRRSLFWFSSITTTVAANLKMKFWTWLAYKLSKLQAVLPGHSDALDGNNQFKGSTLGTIFQNLHNAILIIRSNQKDWIWRAPYTQYASLRPRHTVQPQRIDSNQCTRKTSDIRINESLLLILYYYQDKSVHTAM